MTPAPDFSLDGRIAIVTGAGRGIGRAVADVYARAGADVRLLARTGSEIEDAAGEIRAAGFRAEAAAIDVTDGGAFRGYVASLPRLDILVNNAGTNRPGPFLDVSEEDFDHVAGLNLRAAFFAMQAAASRMAEGGRGGSIVNMSSQMGHVGARNRTLYCATKWALEGLTKAASLELAAHGIRVNTICPTFVETPMTKPFLEDETFRADCLARIKLGRFGSVSDITGAALFLASDASSLMTGTHMLIDGGWTAE
ncbi:SDR family oxidoreductase [Fulvimarina endophytica]|uniref:SDR family oxidoreductase n=1 Tax=Fulvimarina endophytica TaxID=2293836 RepID=A0A371WYA5_9HYPH|nr:SDR family NAD(P)-dependent oxidoreductase [Fulvimarina endophytica]RFC61980.1 SDR family oxidoreductase [Fulvimarina endophytica]